jgi:hypothetical protein
MNVDRPSSFAARAPHLSPGSFAARAPQFSWQLHTVAGFVAASIAFFAAMGGAYYASFLGVLKPFDLDGELSNFIYFPAIFSGGLLFCGAWAALGELHIGASPSWAWRGIAFFFAFMGVDELVTIHEHVEIWTGVDWQLLYLPLVTIGAVCWLAILRSMSTAPLARLMWIGGVGAWLAAQTVEHFEVQKLTFDSNGHPFGALPVQILVEETGEMIGSALFLLAIVAYARRRSASAPIAK